jgi:crossover junction endodeoxyribonuclease RuvC
VIVVAVDPGLSGACSVLDHNGLRALFDLPVMPDPIAGPAAKIKTKIDGRALLRLLRQHCPAREPVQSVLEAIRPMAPKRDGGKDHTAQSQGSLLRTLGAIENTLELLGWTPAYVPPQTWKRYFGLIDPKLTTTQRKAKALRCARTLYPACTEIARAKDHNRAESVLIAHWFRSTNA